jgi:hypothetical protein
MIVKTPLASKLVGVPRGKAPSELRLRMIVVVALPAVSTVQVIFSVSPAGTSPTRMLMMSLLYFSRASHDYVSTFTRLDEVAPTTEGDVILPQAAVDFEIA